jgi:hypothetical protein
MSIKSHFNKSIIYKKNLTPQIISGLNSVTNIAPTSPSSSARHVITTAYGKLHGIKV